MNPTWKELEEHAYRQAVQTHGKEIDTAEALEAHLLCGFEMLQGTKTSSDVQELVYLLSLMATNSLHLAFDLTFKGYYAQSLSLTRNAFEFWLAGAYVVCQPNKALCLKEPDSGWPRPVEMRRIVSASLPGEDVTGEGIRHALDKMYDYLCKFPHPTFLSVGSVYDVGASLRLGPFYWRNRLLICLDNGYRTAVLLRSLLETCFPTLQDTEWSRRGDSLAKGVNLWARTVANGASE